MMTALGVVLGGGDCGRTVGLGWVGGETLRIETRLGETRGTSTGVSFNFTLLGVHTDEFWYGPSENPELDVQERVHREGRSW